MNINESILTVTKALDMKVNIAGIEFKNPIITASGTFGFGKEYSLFYDLSTLGGICTKGLTILPKQGNDSPRIAETASGMLNSVGLQNPGADVFLQDEDPFLAALNTVVIANIAGSTAEDYIKVCEKICTARSVKMIELNISCPNVKQGGMAFGINPESVENITKAVKKHCTKPLVVKLSPNVASISDNARAAENGGADAISLINTITGMAIDWRTKKPILAAKYGGLSGPAIKPVALKMVNEAYNCVKIPIIGMGGIASASDVLEFMIAGATAVQVGTVNLYDPLAAHRLVIELTNLVKSCNINDVASFTGSLIENF